MIKVGINRIKPIADFGECRPSFAVAKRHEGEIQNIIRAVGKEDIFCFHTIKRRQLFLQHPACRVGVKVQPADLLGRNRRHHRRRGRIGRFIRIQLYILLILWLFAGCICLQARKTRTHKSAHWITPLSFRTRAERACASKPSLLAKKPIFSASAVSASFV